MNNILNELDRLFGNMQAAKVDLYNDDKVAIGLLQEKIEDATLGLIDAQEAKQQLLADIEIYKQQLEDVRAANTEKTYAVARCTSLEADVRRLTSDNDTLQKNFTHVFEMQKSKEALLKTAMEVVKNLREKVQQNETFKSQAEHLARQAIKLQQENQTLQQENQTLKDDYAKMMESFQSSRNDMAEFRDENAKMQNEVVELQLESQKFCEVLESHQDEIVRLKEENQKFREQTVRLVNENSQYECSGIKSGAISSMCGGCLSCQLKQAQHTLEQTATNLVERNKERDNYKAELAAVNKKSEDSKKRINELIEELRKTEELHQFCLNAIDDIFHANILKRKGIAKKALDGHNYMLHSNTIISSMRKL